MYYWIDDYFNNGLITIIPINSFSHWNNFTQVFRRLYSLRDIIIKESSMYNVFFTVFLFNLKWHKHVSHLVSFVRFWTLLQVKVDLVGLAQECCPELDLKAELERSFLSEPSSPGHTKVAKGFRLGKHKHETFITSRCSTGGASGVADSVSLQKVLNQRFLCFPLQR